MAGVLTQIQEAEAKKRGELPTGPYVHQEYPKYVRLADGSKALFQTEGEHRAARPEDFEEKPAEKTKNGGKKSE